MMRLVLQISASYQSEPSDLCHNEKHTTYIHELGVLLDFAVSLGEFELGRFSVAFFFFNRMAYILVTKTHPSSCVFYCIQTAYGDVQEDGSGSSSNSFAETAEAMEIFAGMSPEEMEETVKQLMMVVGDDPETQAELEQLLEQIPKMKQQQQQSGGEGSNLDQMVKDDEVAAATQDALRLLLNSDWESVWENQDVILEGVVASGQLDPEDAAYLKTDQSAWKKQLRFIWDELQKQADLQQEL
jgi:hypothetical protein